jgi:hypothetical protein
MNTKIHALTKQAWEEGKASKFGYSVNRESDNTMSLFSRGKKIVSFLVTNYQQGEVTYENATTAPQKEAMKCFIDYWTGNLA